MFERAYRQRLEADLVRWHEAGTISSDTASAIRAALGPLPRAGVTIATVVAILGGLLIAAAFLAFVAANWTTIARPMRFVILLGGIAASYGLGALLAHTGRAILADVSAAVGSIVFGAAIALVGQMYHLGEDFAGGMLLWSLGALAAAVLTGSRGALAVALVAGCIWTGMRTFEAAEVPHLAFIAVWLVGAVLAIVWNAAVARHLIALAALAWWLLTQLGFFAIAATSGNGGALIAGGALMLGGGLALGSLRHDSLSAFGLTHSHYGAFALALAAPTLVIDFFGAFRPMPEWALICAVAGILLALVAAALGRRAGPAFAALCIAALLLALSSGLRPAATGEPWLVYACGLAAMLCLVISGILDEMRPRIVAGWLGLGLMIAAITWSVRGSLLRRSMFLAVSGSVAIALALLLGRLRTKETTA
jgi:uncharacterized membrane protein